MTRIFSKGAARLLPAALVFAAGAAARAQQPQQPQQQPAQTQTQTQTPSQPKPAEQQTAPQPAQQQNAPQPATQAEKAAGAQPAQTQQPAAPAAPADEPLYVEFKGVKLGATREEARKQLGRPQQSDPSQDFFVFSERERARVYYDDKGVVSAVIVTYIGKAANAPTPQAILGSEVEAKQDGSIYKMVRYPKAGYWVAYSRTTGDEPLTIITMQRR